MTYTGLTRGGGFEDALYAGTVTPVGDVHEAPAVASTVGGGHGTVDWEPSPGLVAYAVEAVPVRVAVDRLGHKSTLPRRDSSGQHDSTRARSGSSR